LPLFLQIRRQRPAAVTSRAFQQVIVLLLSPLLMKFRTAGAKRNVTQTARMSAAKRKVTPIAQNSAVKKYFEIFEKELCLVHSSFLFSGFLVFAFTNFPQRSLPLCALPSLQLNIFNLCESV